MRQIVLDTETTGLTPEDGHRIIEIGCVEIVERKITGNRFHVYLNPDREIDTGAIEVHGLDNKFLADKPRFADIAGDFLRYVEGAELVIHNAPFDVGFINHELRRIEQDGPITDYCGVLDTLALARKKHPGQRNGLDALCKRYSVDNSHRDLHGALLDAEILAEVYLAMTGGQSTLALDLEAEVSESFDTQNRTADAKANPRRQGSLKVIRCEPDELQAHQERLSVIDKASGGICLWRQLEPTG
jgi:DNA polymerase III subunit epsilon